MADDPGVTRARQELAAGKHAAALRTAWSTANSGVRTQHYDTVSDVLEIAKSLAMVTDGKHQKDAELLGRYCEAILDGAGERPAPTFLDRLLGRAPREPAREERRRCPDCAEDIHVEAKVCRHCGYRLAPPGSG